MGLTRNYFNWKYYFQNRYSRNSIGTATSYASILDTDLGLKKSVLKPSDYTSNVWIFIYLSRTSSSTNITNLSYVADNYKSNVAMYSSVGSSDKKENIDDYELDVYLDNVTSTISSYNYENSEDFKISTVYTVTGKNNNTETVTIKEVGLFRCFAAGASSSYQVPNGNNFSPNYLFLRKVLDTPITVGPSQEYRIEVKMTEDLNLSGGE